MPYMALYRERVLLAGGAAVEAAVEEGRRYRLCLRREGAPLVEYWSNGAVCRKRVGGRISAYEFRSVEQLRYDFERDAEDALGTD